MSPLSWSTLIGILIMLGTINSFLVPWVHEALPYYDENYIESNVLGLANDNTNRDGDAAEIPMITIVKKPKKASRGFSEQHPKSFGRMARNTRKDPVLIFSTLLNHQ